jgi:Tfp pilus assembly protein PilN
MSTELLTRPTTTAIVPTVNLLPPEIGEAIRLRALKVQLGIGVAAAVGVVALLGVVAGGQVSSANEALEVATAQTAAAQAKVDALASVPLVYGQVAAAKGNLQTAMGTDVRWSNLLTDVSLTVPDGIALETLKVTQAAADAQAPTLSPLSSPGIATVDLTGKAAEYNDVATFLDRLAKQNNQIDPFYTNGTVEADENSGRDVVQFSASTTVTDAARSNRYTEGG